MCAQRALVNIDYTNDFVAEDGRLTCGKPGQFIEENIVSLTKSFLENGDDVVFAIDCHYENDSYHPETKLFPPHNILGTKGRQLYGKLQPLYDEYKGSKFVHTIDKTRYSAFCGTNLELKLRERGIEELHLCGVCTDICVLHTAVDAYNKGFKLVIHETAVASFNAEGHKWALGHFRDSLGAEVR